MSLLVTIALLAIGLCLSAFFSGTETALTALPVSRVDALARHGRRFEKLAWRRWRQRPHRVLVTLLVGNTFVNIGMSAIATEAAIRLWGDTWVGIVVGIVTFMVLVFGEVTPKTLARVDPQRLGRAVILPIAGLDWMLTPLTGPLLGLSHIVARLIKVPLSHQPTAARPEDLRFMMSLSRQEGHLTELQHGMLEAVLRIEYAQVRHVQTPRTDVVFLADTLALDEVRSKVLASGYSRYPVYHERDDNVIGILYVKDLLRPEQRKGDWTQSLQPPLFVPESKRVVDLLREMRDRRTHVAIAIDEYGNIAGLASLEDLIELIVGDINDEFDTAEPMWRAEGPQRWLVRGNLPLERLQHLTGVPIAAETDYTSVGGLLLSIAGKVPCNGDSFQLDRLHFEVVESSPRRVKHVRVSVADQPA
jgi:putative hemolysin